VFKIILQIVSWQAEIEDSFFQVGSWIEKYKYELMSYGIGILSGFTLSALIFLIKMKCRRVVVSTQEQS